MQQNNCIIKNHLSDTINSVCLKIWGVVPLDTKIETTPKDFDGDYTFVTFIFAKQVKQSPDSVANQIGHNILHLDKKVRSFSVVKGFLNIVLCDTFLLERFKYITSNHLLCEATRRKKILVEFSSPNTNKPLHLGHLRNNFIGQSIARILQYIGHTVNSVSVVNDKGIHICKSMVAYRNFGNSQTPETTGIKSDKFVGNYYVLFDKKDKEETATSNSLDVRETKVTSNITRQAQEMLVLWEKGDKDTLALWEKMNNWVYSGFEKTYKKIGVAFDKVYYESKTFLLGKETVRQGLEAGIFYKKDDNSVWVDLAHEGLDHKLLIRADGTSVYITQDLAMADLRYKEYNFDACIYVVGNEQDYHFKVLFLILKKLNRPYADNLHHLSYGMVDLPSGKMKSREGTVVDADDLIAEVEALAEKKTTELGKIDDLDSDKAKELYKTLALGALKYQILKVDPQKKILFNPHDSIDFQGDTGPFIQYTHARIFSILNKAKASDIKKDIKSLPEDLKLLQLEKEIIIKTSEFNENLHEAAQSLNPSIIAHYVYDLCKLYNKFYAEIQILQESDNHKRAFRIKISEIVKELIKTCMHLLCIDVPNKM